VVNPPPVFSVHIKACSDVPALASGKVERMATIARNGRESKRAIDTRCLGIGFYVT
jgi:hypothetical protein